MAKLFISEFGAYSVAVAGGAPVANMPPLVEQTPLDIGTVVQSAAFGATTRLIRVQARAACSIAVGPNPAATIGNLALAGNQTEYFSVNPGDKLSVISNP